MIDAPRYYDSEHHRVSYLRIPKTASTSVVEALALIEVDRPKYKLITVIRNPIDRILSMYYECVRCGHFETQTLNSWLNRVMGQGYYNSHTYPMYKILNQSERILYKIYDAGKLSRLESDYDITLPLLNCTDSKARILYDDDDLHLAFMAYSKDFLLYTKCKSKAYGEECV